MAVTAVGAACSEDASTDGSAADGGGDRRAPRPTPTAEEAEEDAPTCARADAAAVDPPAEYRTLKNPLAITSDVVASGSARFADRCALCHGDEGKGDGREGPFDPSPANFTVRRRSDPYLFWRITTGGASPPFCSAMPAWEGLYSETQRWELVAFIQETFAPKLDGGSDAADAE